VCLHLADEKIEQRHGSLLLKKVWLTLALRSSLISISDLDKTSIATLFNGGIGKLLDHQDHSRIYGFTRIIGEHY
jgi:hypothetical protein